MARLLMAALTQAGHRVTLASRFRSWDNGDQRRQQRLQQVGERLAQRLLHRYRRMPAHARPTAWFTYHLYHKAPDWLGPQISRALAIPYIVAEASYAPKQAYGRWALGHAAAAAAITAAHRVITLNPNDSPCLLALLQDPERLLRLPPFLDTRGFLDEETDTRTILASRYGLASTAPWLLTVAMMREGDKLASYRVLATALKQLQGLAWQALIIGDGSAREQVHAAFAALPTQRVQFLGQQPQTALRAWCKASDLMLWPALNEAYGMALLEAQAAGLAVVAGAAGGVPEIISDGETGVLVPPHDAGAFAQAVAALLNNPSQRACMGSAARRKARAVHDINSAASVLNRVLQQVTTA